MASACGGGNQSINVMAWQPIWLAEKWQWRNGGGYNVNIMALIYISGEKPQEICI